MNELKVSLVLVVSRLTFRLAPTIPRNCATFVVSKNALYQGPPETNQPPLPPPRTRTIFAGSAMNYMYVRACAKRLRPPSSLRSILKADLATASEPLSRKNFRLVGMRSSRNETKETEIIPRNFLTNLLRETRETVSRRRCLSFLN